MILVANHLHQEVENSSNVKNIPKNMWVIILGVFVCVVIILGISFYRLTYLSHIPFNNHEFSNFSEGELNVFHKIKEFYENRDVEKLNEIIKIDKGEIEIIINGPKCFHVTRPPIAEVIIKNISERKIIVFEPSLTHLTQESYYHKGYVQDDYIMSFSISLLNKFRLLKSGEKIYIPVLFDVSGIGTHKVNINFDFPIFNEISEDNIKIQSSVIVRANYIFDIYTE